MNTNNKIEFLLNPKNTKIKSSQVACDSDTEYSSDTEAYIQVLESILIPLVITNEPPLNAAKTLSTNLKRRK